MAASAAVQRPRWRSARRKPKTHLWLGPGCNRLKNESSALVKQVCQLGVQDAGISAVNVFQAREYFPLRLKMRARAINIFHCEVFARQPRLTESLSEKGVRLCRRPAAARGKLCDAPKKRGTLRLVEDDTAALRDFQTRSEEKWRVLGTGDGQIRGNQPT